MEGGIMVSRTNPLAWLVVLFVGVFIGAIAAGPAAAQVSAQFVYLVHHSVFGDIGTYTNIVEPSREGTTVRTHVHFDAKMLGVRLHHQDADRIERWQGNRLVSFRSITDKGDGPKEVKGEARGNSFVVSSPQGTFTAPAWVHPANPWSANFLHSTTMMRPDTGKIEQVRIGGGQETAVKIDGATIPAVKYDIDGSTKYTVWLDARGVPVMFCADDDTGKVTFTLAKCIGCDTALSELSRRQ
jgi:hypothetical protein